MCGAVEFAEVAEKEEEDYDQFARGLEDASPLEIMDKALEKFGNDIAIAFRYILVPLIDGFTRILSYDTFDLFCFMLSI